MRAHLDRVLPLSAAAHELSVELGWSGVTQLDGELALVAVDRAGNESEPSAPVRVSWSGCTDFYDEPFCLDGGAMPQAAPAQASKGCGVVTGPRAARSAPLGAALAMGLIAALRSRRSRSPTARAARVS
jgi:hypothetical protein